MRACVRDEPSRAHAAARASFGDYSFTVVWRWSATQRRRKKGGSEEKRLIAERSLSTLVYCIITRRIECGPAACAQVGRAADAEGKRLGVLGLRRRERPKLPAFVPPSSPLLSSLMKQLKNVIAFNRYRRTACPSSFWLSHWPHALLLRHLWQLPEH